MRIEYLEAALSDLDNITDYYFALFGIESAIADTQTDYPHLYKNL